MPTKADRSWLRNCIELHENESGSVGVVRHGCGGKRPTMASGRIPNLHLLRRRRGQGRRFKCPAIREQLWDWFVDVRGSIASTISPKFVMLKARSIAHELFDIQRRTGCYTAMPKIDKFWLLRWKRDYGVVWRKPNRKFKASKATMIRRLRAMWLNTIRVRRLASLALDTDLADKFYGIDEKPLHFNEGGSKDVRTLEIAGAPAVRLKRNHAASRERVSVMTLVTSDQCSIDNGLPVTRRKERLFPRVCSRFVFCFLFGGGATRKSDCSGCVVRVGAVGGGS